MRDDVDFRIVRDVFEMAMHRSGKGHLSDFSLGRIWEAAILLCSNLIEAV